MKHLMIAWLLLACAAAEAQSPLANLIQSGNRASALELIENGADVNASQGDGTTPQHWAVYKVAL